nr:hypothetical protein [Tanacetum cinerariifolium]
AKESGVDEQELGKLELDKLVLGKLEVSLLPGRIGFFLSCSPEDYDILDSCFGSKSYGSDCYGSDFG